MSQKTRIKIIDQVSKILMNQMILNPDTSNEIGQNRALIMALKKVNRLRIKPIPKVILNELQKMEAAFGVDRFSQISRPARDEIMQNKKDGSNLAGVKLLKDILGLDLKTAKDMWDLYKAA